MASVQDIVNVNIDLTTSQVQRASFGIPMVVARFTNGSGRVLTYSASTALSSMLTDGFATTDIAYKSVQAFLSANPRVASVKVGRRSSSWQQLTKITPTVATNLGVYSVRVNGTLATFTADSSATIAEICTGLAAAIDALPLVSAVSNTTHITVTTTASNTLAIINGGTSSAMSNDDAIRNLKVEDVTVDGGIAADLAAIRIVDSSWYGFVIDSNADAEIIEAADWAEATRVVFGATLRGNRCADSTDTTDTASTMKASGYRRTFGIYHSDASERAADRWIGEMFPEDPSFGETWAYSQLSGVAVETLSESQKSAIKGKNVNVYETIAGVNVTTFGYMFEAQTTFIDQVTGVDELQARIEEGVAGLVFGKKLPYSNKSADRICGEILRIIYIRVERGFLAAVDADGNAPTCTHPDVLTGVSDSDRQNRLLPDIEFSAQTAGRIHTVAIRGTLTV